MLKFNESLHKMKRVAPKSFAFLIITPIAGIVSLLLSKVYFAQSLVKLPDCVVKRITGIPCPSCGMTRAVYAITRMQLVKSFLYHPAPILTSILLLAVWINSLVNVFIRKMDRRFPYMLLWYYLILSAVVVFWLFQLYRVFTGS